jgi:WD40 repeat protein
LTRALACLSAGLILACASRTARVPDATASAVAYSQVNEILRESCEHCHNEDKAKGGLLMGSYEALLAGGEHGSAVIPGESASSRLMRMIDGKLKPRMPYKEAPLAERQAALIRRWIDEGARGPAASDAKHTPAAADVKLADIRPTVPVAGAVAAVAFDPSSRRIAVGSYRSLHLMTLVDRKWSGTAKGHADIIRALAFAPDGKRLAVAGGPSGRFGEIRIWDVQGAVPKAVADIRGHTDSILAVAFSPDGRTIASGSYDKLVKLWDAATGKQIANLKEHSDAVFGVAFMPGGKHLVTGAGDRTVKVWDVSTGKRVFTITDALEAVYSVAVHPSGTRIAAAGADRMVRTWSWNRDAASGTGTATLLSSTFAHGDAVLQLAYSPDGSMLVSTGADRGVKVWDGATLREKHALEPQPDWVMGLAISADGKWLAAGRYDGTLGLYALANGRSGEQFVVPHPEK